MKNGCGIKYLNVACKKHLLSIGKFEGSQIVVGNNRVAIFGFFDIFVPKMDELLLPKKV